jgi:hypothetical protein
MNPCGALERQIKRDNLVSLRRKKWVAAAHGRFPIRTAEPDVSEYPSLINTISCRSSLRPCPKSVELSSNINIVSEDT